MGWILKKDTAAAKAQSAIFNERGHMGLIEAILYFKVRIKSCSGTIIETAEDWVDNKQSAK